MHKWIVGVCVSVGVLSHTLMADALKNSLTNIMKRDDSVPMVDLSNFNLNAKPKPPKATVKKHAPNDVVGSVNGHKIIKKDADAYLKQRTAGKVDNYDKLKPKQQKMLLEEMGLPYLAYDAAMKELSEAEKEAVLNRLWMQKEAAKISIDETKIQEVYEQMKQETLKTRGIVPIPAYEDIKEKLRMQMVEKEVMSRLMKDVQIEVLD